MADGGREAGDVELALFKKESLDSGEALRDPLSLLSVGDAYAPPDAPAPAARTLPTSIADKAQARTLLPSSLPQCDAPPSPSPRGMPSARTQVTPPSSPTRAPEALTSLKRGAAAGLVPESSWRDAMVRACADLLGKSLDELTKEFKEAGGKGTGPHAPRDLADFAIMMTLRTRDAFAMQNAPSWLFNTMDRSGAGYVLREEFVRYTPFMSPIADAAVATIIFDELLRAQVSAQAKKDVATGKNVKGAPPSRPARFQRTRERTSVLAVGAVNTARQYSDSLRQSSGLRRRQGELRSTRTGGSSASSTGDRGATDTVQSPPDDDSDDDGMTGSEGSRGEMYPISEALRFDTWKQYFDAIQTKYHYRDAEWPRVRAELGLDTSERLIKAQGALDHSLVLPTLGKLYLTQRYLVFFAAVGQNHYVARLGAVSDVGVRSLPLLMRDCFTVKLESETHSALHGISANADAAAAIAHRRPSGAKIADGPCVAPRRTSLTEADIRQRKRNSLPRPGDESLSDGVSLVGDEENAEMLSVLTENEIVMPSSSTPERNGASASGSEMSWRKASVSRLGDSGDTESDEERNADMKGGSNGWDREKSMPQHVAEVMQQFTAGGKLLVFSLIEIRDTSRRDLWKAVILELTAAHKLHLQLGFGSSGRVVPDMYAEPDDPTDSNSWGAAEGSPRGTSSYLTYLSSPFRNEPPPPLLAVAAHANVVRYRAIRVIDGARSPLPLLVFSHAQRCKVAVSWYVDSVREHDNRGGRSWIERAMDAIRENMELNKRVYVVNDDEPFDVARLGEGIGRLAELCTPLVRVSQFATHIIQWRNPPATILALFICLYIVYYRLVVYLPGVVLFAIAGVIVATRSRMFGLDSWLWGGGRPEDAKERQANVLELVSQVHDTLRAGQNVIKRLNVALGKVQTLCVWGSGEEWLSWMIVGFLVVVGLLLLLADARVLFTILVWILFSKHFLPPDNIIRKFWSCVPERVPNSEVMGSRDGRGVLRNEAKVQRTTNLKI